MQTVNLSNYSVFVPSVLGVKYIEMYLNTNSLEDSNTITNTFKHKYIKYKYTGKYFKYLFKYFSFSGYITMGIHYCVGKRKAYIETSGL